VAGNRRFASLILAVGVALRAAAAVAAEGGAGATGGPVVSSLSFQIASPYPLTYEELYGLAAIRPGDPLTAERIRDSIRRLYTKSVFRKVTAYVREEGGKADLVIFLQPIPLVTEIEVAGQKALTASQIVPRPNTAGMYWTLSIGTTAKNARCAATPTARPASGTRARLTP